MKVIGTANSSLQAIFALTRNEFLYYAEQKIAVGIPFDTNTLAAFNVHDNDGDYQLAGALDNYMIDINTLKGCKILGTS